MIMDIKDLKELVVVQDRGVWDKLEVEERIKDTNILIERFWGSVFKVDEFDMTGFEDGGVRK